MQSALPSDDGRGEGEWQRMRREMRKRALDIRQRGRRLRTEGAVDCESLVASQESDLSWLMANCKGKFSQRSAEMISVIDAAREKTASLLSQCAAAESSLEGDLRVLKGVATLRVRESSVVTSAKVEVVLETLRMAERRALRSYWGALSESSRRGCGEYASLRAREESDGASRRRRSEKREERERKEGRREPRLLSEEEEEEEEDMESTVCPAVSTSLDLAMRCGVYSALSDDLIRRHVGLRAAHYVTSDVAWHCILHLRSDGERCGEWLLKTRAELQSAVEQFRTESASLVASSSSSSSSVSFSYGLCDVVTHFPLRDAVFVAEEGEEGVPYERSAALLFMREKGVSLVYPAVRISRLREDAELREKVAEERKRCGYPTGE
jgi:hypothetical protein